MSNYNRENPESCSCNGCIYWRWIYGHGNCLLYACHYLLDTDKMRGCPVEGCTRKTTKGAENNGRIERRNH